MEILFQPRGRYAFDASLSWHIFVPLIFLHSVGNLDKFQNHTAMIKHPASRDAGADLSQFNALELVVNTVSGASN